MDLFSLLGELDREPGGTEMDDLYCPICRFVLFAPAVAAREHCPRCAARSRVVRLRPRRPADMLAARAGSPRRSLVEVYNATLAGRSPMRIPAA
jgi:hypothetical protein